MKPVKSLNDLRLAQARLSSLISSNESGENDDEIEVLATLIEHFELQNFPIDAPGAIEAIRFRMQESDLSPRHLEPFIGSRARVSEVLSGKRNLSIDMIRSLHEGLGIPYAALIPKRVSDNAQKIVVTPSAVAKLKALGFDIKQGTVSTFVQSLLSEPEHGFLMRKTRSSRAAAKTDQASLLLWQAAVLRKAKDKTISSGFSADRLDESFLRKIARLSQSPDGPSSAIQMLAGVGIQVVLLPHLPGTFLDGGAMLSRQKRPIIALTLRYDRTDNFWFTLLHEASHIKLHFEDLCQHDFAFFDDMDIQSEDSREQEADTLAQRSLIPDAILRSVRWDADTSAAEIIAVSTRARVHASIAAGRWQRDHQNYRKFARLIERDKIRPTLLEGSR
jgi:HTH-type transcriptional regulator / antitoxin HigA